MQFVILGWPEDGQTLRLDHEQFRYAGKFVMSNTGKVVAREQGELVGAIAFNEDRTDSASCWLRYVTVRDDRRGEAIGPRLAGGMRELLLNRGYDAVRIAVNNPFAYRALYKAGFCFTGRRTGLAELVLQAPCSKTDTTYRDGMAIFGERDLSDVEQRFLSSKRSRVPPDLIEVPKVVEPE
ncbi:MAG: hypothetical protein ACI9PP_000320 [Halobacteriales archaeon]|jgi:hypothetical protein